MILLSDGYLANGSEPWKLPDIASLPDISVPFATEFNHVDDDGNPEFWPYLRDEVTLARPWAIPGTPGLMHRVGGLEKADGTGNIDYTPENHERMVHLRAAKVAAIAADIPPIDDPRRRRCRRAGRRMGLHVGGDRRRRATAPRAGHKVASTHLVHLNPLPSDLGEVLGRYRKVIVPELNSGQLCNILRAKYLVDARVVVEGAGPAVQVTRDRSRHRRGARRTRPPIDQRPAGTEQRS